MNSEDFEAPCSEWQTGANNGAGALLTPATSGRDDPALYAEVLALGLPSSSPSPAS